MAEKIPKTDYLRKLAPDIEVLDYLEKFAVMNPTAFNAEHIHKDVFYYDETPPNEIPFPPNVFRRWLIHYENKAGVNDISAIKQNDDEFVTCTVNSEKYAILICDDPTDDDKKMTISGISFLSGVAF